MRFISNSLVCRAACSGLLFLSASSKNLVHCCTMFTSMNTSTICSGGTLLIHARTHTHIPYIIWGKFLMRENDDVIDKFLVIISSNFPYQTFPLVTANVARATHVHQYFIHRFFKANLSTISLIKDLHNTECDMCTSKELKIRIVIWSAIHYKPSNDPLFRTVYQQKYTTS